MTRSHWARPFRAAARGPRHAPSGAGFTLVELLIALSLIALITLLLFSGLRLGSRAWEGVERVATRNAEQRIARNFLVGVLSQARLMLLPFDGEQRYVFAGDAQRLEFVAPLSERTGIPGLYLLRLTLQKDGDQPALVLTRWLLHPEVLAGTAESPAWQPLMKEGNRFINPGDLDRDAAAGAYGATLLLSDVEKLEISYFGLRAGQEQGEWSADWLDQPSLPQRIHIRLTTPGQVWPDLLVKLPKGQ